MHYNHLEGACMSPSQNQALFKPGCTGFKRLVLETVKFPNTTAQFLENWFREISKFFIEIGKEYFFYVSY